MAWPSSLKREAYGMGGRTGASFGTGTRFRHGGGLEDLLLPDGITSTGSTQEEVILALCHYNIGTLHGSQLSCVGGMSRRWGLEKGRNNTNIGRGMISWIVNIMSSRQNMTRHLNNLLKGNTSRLI